MLIPYKTNGLDETIYISQCELPLPKG
jgi:hypothetical protein